MAKIIKFPLQAVKGHGGASRPPRERRAEVIELRPVTPEELEELLKKAKGATHERVAIGHVLLTFEEVAELLEKTLQSGG